MNRSTIPTALTPNASNSKTSSCVSVLHRLGLGFGIGRHGTGEGNGWEKGIRGQWTFLVLGTLVVWQRLEVRKLIITKTLRCEGLKVGQLRINRKSCANLSWKVLSRDLTGRDSKLRSRDLNESGPVSEGERVVNRVTRYVSTRRVPVPSKI